ncbi:signal recognition particle, SRP9/SRP14 subunit [Cladochytrium replicatum]|nr:signal recognition particle, SRP9/SRP14 subunit [Cladochytrium replicatum]
MKELDNDAFLVALGKQFEKTKSKGTVYLTMKRFAFEKKQQLKKELGNQPTEDELSNPDFDYPCLIRAVCGNEKLSTKVRPENTDKFLEKYAIITRVHMDSLKKKEKTKKAKKAKLDAAASSTAAPSTAILTAN